MSTKWDSLLAISRQCCLVSPLDIKSPPPPSTSQVVCSVEYEDEVSGVLLAWKFHPLQQWRAKEHHLNSGSLPTNPTSPLSPVHTNVQLSMSAWGLSWLVNWSSCWCQRTLIFIIHHSCVLGAQHVTIVCVSVLLLFCGPFLICISISKQSFTDTANVHVVWWCVNTEWGVASCQLDNTSNDPALKRIKWINGNMQGVSLSITMCSYNLCSIQCA